MDLFRPDAHSSLEGIQALLDVAVLENIFGIIHVVVAWLKHINTSPSCRGIVRGGLLFGTAILRRGVEWGEMG